MWDSRPSIVYNGSNHSIVTHQGGVKFFDIFFWLIPTPMVITRWDIAIWGVRTTKKPQIWPYFGPRSHNGIQRANLRILKNKVQPAITGAFLSPDAKCYTISESSGQPDSGNLGPTAHRVNLGCQPAAFATQVKISPPDFRPIYLFWPPSRFGLFGHKSQG